MIHELNERARQILRLVVDAYVETGEPVGSKLISQKLGMKLSPATIRHAMVELEELGLLYSPHTSAGRLPTDTGLMVFVDGLLQVGDVAADDRQKIDQTFGAVKGQPLPDILEQASSFLSGLSSCAGLVFSPKAEAPVKQVQFVLLAPGRVLAVLVFINGGIENRVMEVGHDVTATALQQASNYLNSRIANKTLQEAALQVRAEIMSQKAQLDALTAQVVETGLVSMSAPESGGHFFIRGQANLLDDIAALEDLERIRGLFAALEAKETMLKILEATSDADGVKIFIGSENKLFSHSGCTLVLSPYKDSDARMVGVIGVIGPTRLNYGRIIPVVDYTSQMISKVIR